jgi:hypothetical protein
MTICKRTSAMLLLLACSSLHAKNYAEKTFLAPFAAQPFTMASMWDAHKETNLHRIEIQPFYMASTDSNKLGQYFGIGNGKNSFTIGDPAAAAPAEVNSRYIIHRNGGPVIGTVTFKPERKALGVVLGYQNLNFLNCKRLFATLSMPITHLEHGMHVAFADTVNAPLANGQLTSLENFFKGNLEILDDPAAGAFDDLTVALHKAKITRRQSATGVADVNVTVGARLYDTAQSHIHAAFVSSIASVKKGTGEYLFEPVLGNRGHSTVGLALDAAHTFAPSEHWHVTIGSNTAWHYGLKATEERTLAFSYSPDNVKQHLTQYYALGRTNFVNGGGTTVNIPFTPAANILTQPLLVKPGSDISQVLSLAATYSNMQLTARYNLRYHEAEKVALPKGFTLDGSNLVIPHPGTTSDTPLAIDTGAGRNADILTTAMLDLKAATTPAQTAHALIGELTVTKLPLSMVASVGGSYEWAQDNSSLSQYGIWLKAAFSF